MTDDRRRAEGLHGTVARLQRELEEARQVVSTLRARFELQSTELAASKGLSKSVVDFVGVAIAVSDVRGNWLRCNTCFEELLGYSLMELRERTNIQITHPDDRQRSRKLMHDLIEGEIDAFRLEKRYRHRDGNYVWVDLSVTPIRDESGEIVALIGAAMDINRRKNAEGDLAWELDIQSAVASLGRSLLDSTLSIEGVANLVLGKARTLTSSEHGYVSAIDPETGDNIGYTLTQMMGDSADLPQNGIAFPKSADGKYPGLWGHALNTGEAFYTNTPSEHEAAGRRPENHLLLESFLTVPVTAGGEVLGQIALANAPDGYLDQDLEAIERLAYLFGLALQRERESEQKVDLTTQLRHSQKMEAIGLLASGVAHDFNNQLTAISALSEMALRKLEKGHPVHAGVQQILKVTESSRDLTRQLLAFSRKQVLELQSVHFNELTESFVVMLRRTIREDIEIGLRLSREDPWIRGDPVQIEQILINLSVNAQDAMPEGGMLNIEVGSVHLDEEDTRRYPEAKPGQYATLTVRDTGHGMDEETQNRAFEPFFTTKETGQGTGLGLSTIWGIVRQHGGHVRLQSDVGEGTTFALYFPQLGAPPPMVLQRPEQAQLPKGTETIMVVEDDRIVRKSICRMLQILGYHVLEARGGERGLELIEETEGKIDLLLTDVIMPEMNGKELADKITAKHPHVRVLFMSGYADDVLSQYGILNVKLHYMHKPFAVADIARKLREMLDG